MAFQKGFAVCIRLIGNAEFMFDRFLTFFIENKLIVFLLLLFVIGWGLITMPFNHGVSFLPKDPVAVDAIPDIGENQQIVYTPWSGRSPQDVEDQITYPLTTTLLGIPGVKNVRSNSMFGFSSIYIIFDEEIEFYWSRSRILEKLNALPANLLPEGVQPSLGPDATALGQIFWYTLEGRDEEGQPVGGWDLHELRSIQDFYVRYGLSAAKGVSEIASVGGYVKEYQILVNPNDLVAHQLDLIQVMDAIKSSNLDVGARTMEINLAEYFVRGLGYITSIEDIENTVIVAKDNVPVRIKDIAQVNIGPASRRGVLDKSGAEAVGGVVVARYGANPMEVIQKVKEKIEEIAPGLPEKTLADGRTSKVTIVPFYDRTQLINETLGTLQEALSLEILITILVVILMLFNLNASLIVSATLPLAVLICFIIMRYTGVDANIVALSGIAIAIGTMVDMGIVLTESIIRKTKTEQDKASWLQAVFEATKEVSPAIITAVVTTIISFLPVFTMEAAEGKLFRPLAFTKTYALLAAILVSLILIPAISHLTMHYKGKDKSQSVFSGVLLIIMGFIIRIKFLWFNVGLLLILIGSFRLLGQLIKHYFSSKIYTVYQWVENIAYALIVSYVLAGIWMPLGVNHSVFTNFLFVSLIAGFLILFFQAIIYFYTSILTLFLRFKLLFLIIPFTLVVIGYRVFNTVGQEFMPSLNEGAFLLMPTSMPHTGVQENLKNLRLLDMAVTAIPEVESVVGKIGRVESALDPAPLSMFENVIFYKSEYKTDANGHRLRFKTNDQGEFIYSKKEKLIPDPNGRYFRQWRDHIQSTDDIWKEIAKVTKLPGVVSAPKLQPIETRIIMLQTGLRAPMGIKVKGNDLQQIETFGLALEKVLKQVKGVKKSAVFAERIIGKPYLKLKINRQALSRYGLSVEKVQRYISTAIGGMKMTETVEGREHYDIIIQYPRALRSDPEIIKEILVSTPAKEQIPLGELITIEYEQGPQSIKSEDGFLISYVMFDKEDGYAETNIINKAKSKLAQQIKSGKLKVPAGVSFHFAGNFENQVRANNRLKIILPLSLGLIFLILYLLFNSIILSLIVFTGVLVAFAGGFAMIGLYATPYFMDFELFGENMRTLFQIHPINLSVAVWVGFLALFGIATDDGVLVGSFLKDSFEKNKPNSIEEIRMAVIEGGNRRVRPAMMTTATTILALLPILTSTGRGSDILIPMAIPSFGGMVFQILTMFIVPVLFCFWKEWEWRIKHRNFSFVEKNKNKQQETHD